MGLWLILATPAFAQQQPDPALLQKLINQLTMQRDRAMLDSAQLELQVERLKAELEKLKNENQPGRP